MFNPKLLGDMVHGLSDDPPVSFMRNQVILKEGQIGTRMYAVQQTTRLASAVAEGHAVLQPINRNAFIALVKLDPDLGVALLTALAERLRYLTGLLK